MARKVTTETPAGAAPARAAKASPKTIAPVKKAEPKTAPKATRTTAARHTKLVAEPVAAPVMEVVAPVAAVAAPFVNSHEAVAKLAYGYWAARGYLGGNQLEDWLRAEAEYSASV